MKKERCYRVPGFGSLIKLPLRRSIQVSFRYSTKIVTEARSGPYSL